jgi:hypothetical protein
MATLPPNSTLPGLLAAIPFANDGDVITRDHHNTLRSALVQVASAVGQTQLDPVQTLSFTPVLLPVIGSAEWRTTFGFAAGPPPTAGGTARGWMTLELPHGTTIDGMAVRGSMPTTVALWTVALRRLELAGSLTSDVYTSEIQNTPKEADGSFLAPVEPRTAQLTPQQVADLRRVDNTKYRYLFNTTMAGAQQSDAVELRLVQVTCTRG